MKIRHSTKEDIPYLKKWLMEEDVIKYFPLFDEREVDDAAKIWVSYGQIGASFTALDENDTPCGVANIYVSPFSKLKHQALFAIIMDPKKRNQGIGTKLLNHLIKEAKDTFQMTLLHLEVYKGNPAISLYERLGFEKYGEHKDFLKEKDGSYVTKVLMQLKL